MIMKYFVLITILALLLSLVPGRPVFAFTFNPENIITDFELKDKDSMSLRAIQSFLEKHQSVLKNYPYTVNGIVKSATEIIYEAAQAYGISPKFILTKLDHEQCLVRGCSYHNDPAKLQRALDFAAGFGVCTGCNLNDPKVQKYKGFAKQVDAVASVQNDYIRKAGINNVRAKGDTFKTSDGFSITPKNQATANLYTYTPYRGGVGNNIGGNYFFAKLWDEYWGSLLYPDGSILTDGNSYWLVDGGAKRRYASLSVFVSGHSSKDAITVSSAVLEEYPDGPDIRFPNYSLVQDETGMRYLLIDTRKRAIADDETFRLFGFNPEEVEIVNSNEIASYSKAVPITKDDLNPQGALGKDTRGALHFVQNGFKYAVHEEIAALNYPGLTPRNFSDDELKRYYQGEPQKIKDGKFIKSREGKIYLVSRGVLRPIKSVSEFFALFGEEKFLQVAEVSGEVIAIHTIGEHIEAGAEYERNGASAAQTPSAEGTVSKALWISADSPRSVTAGKNIIVPVRFKNKSVGVWGKGDVYLTVEETGDRAENTDIVPPDHVYAFMVPLNLAIKGEQVLTFQLRGKDGGPVQGGLYQTRILVVAPEYMARIISHTIPGKVQQSKTPTNIEVKIKNEGVKPWVRRKTGLKMFSDGGFASPFYDPRDWLDKEIASVSLTPKKDVINPGESAVFRFTLKTESASLSAHTYRLALFMTDKKEIVYLNGKDFWEGVVRVER